MDDKRGVGRCGGERHEHLQQGVRVFGSRSPSAGDLYVGEFRDDRFEGTGAYLWADGNRYEGSFRDGRFAGQGCLIRVDDSRQCGEWQDGKLVRPE